MGRPTLLSLESGSPGGCIPHQTALLKWPGAGRLPFSCPCPVWSLKPIHSAALSAQVQKDRLRLSLQAACLSPAQQKAAECQNPDAAVGICGDGFPSSLPANTTFALPAAFLTQTVCLDDTTVKFEIWDTAGQERYHSLAPMYYRGAQAAIVVYDITNTVKIFPLLLDPCFWTGSGQISSVVWGVSSESSGW